MTRVVCISDTHGMHDRVRVPNGDLLIHAGDFTARGAARDVDSFNSWLGALPHKERIVIAGNHDRIFESDPGLARSLLTNATYLRDSEHVTHSGLKIYGSPWSLPFMDWSFMLPENELAKKWALIPVDTDILVTHGPPSGFGDVVDGWQHVGSETLHETLVFRVLPKVHVFGHIHEGYGQHGKGRTKLVNASICTEDYKPTNAPIVIDIT
jgi:Icc-related predicted phosphoesterase